MSFTEHDSKQSIMLSDKADLDARKHANEMFAALMNRAIRKGREKARPGTFVDLTPAYEHKRFYGEPFSSSCGSPAALCTEISGDPYSK